MYLFVWLFIGTKKMKNFRDNKLFNEDFFFILDQFHVKYHRIIEIDIPLSILNFFFLCYVFFPLKIWLSLSGLIFLWTKFFSRKFQKRNDTIQMSKWINNHNIAFGIFFFSIDKRILNYTGFQMFCFPFHFKRNFKSCLFFLAYVYFASMIQE